MRALRVGVVGVGYMGRRHAEKVVALARDGADVVLSGVNDRDESRARDGALAFGAPALELDALLRRSDAVVVAVPTSEHRGVVEQSIRSGCDVLVEKPIAATVAEAESLLALATEHDRVLHVGHLEWYNAAARVIRGRVRGPRFVEVRRMGPFPDRSTDVDVVRDLMIHDLEILQQVLGAEPERIEALGVPVLTDQVDIANARISFGSKCIADLTASRVSFESVRKMRFFQRDGFISVDFLEQRANIYRRVADGDGARVEVEKLRFDPEDALLTQLRSFTDAVRKRDPGVESARSAVAALRTALRVIEAMPPVEDLD